MIVSSIYLTIYIFIDKNLYNEIENYLETDHYLHREKKLIELIDLLNTTQKDYLEFKEKIKLDRPEDKEEFSEEEIIKIKETISEFSKI